MQVNKLVKMANQIAQNMDYGADKTHAVEGTADHLRRFWTPDMLAAIVEYAKRETNELSEVAALSVAEIARNRSNAA
jgi:formate dehydrogenase subunit delta